MSQTAAIEATIAITMQLWLIISQTTIL